jgi:endonuclease G, mitochondrial
MKKILTILYIFLNTVCFSQIQLGSMKYDTLLTNTAYKSYYSYSFRAPVAVVYNLYCGGGDCARDKMDFKNDVKGLKTAYDSDYKSSGYDKGHMANAEDFAYDCTLEELTFRYYNCVPQTPELNRGPWKQFETLIRKLSQSDSLVVICYNEFTSKKIKNVNVPTKCYKLVYDLVTKKVVYAFYYTNTKTPVYHDLIKKPKEYKFMLDLIKK